MPKDTFLFVPYRNGKKNNCAKNTTSLEVSDSDARSHAAAVSRRRRELNGRTRDHLDTVLQVIEQTPVPSSDQSVIDDGENSSVSISPTSDSHSSGRTRDQRRQNMRAMQFSWRAGTGSASTIENALFNGWRSDPFGVSAGSRYADAVVDYYSQVITPVNHPVYAIFDVTNVYTSYFLDLLQNDDYRYAGLAMVGAIMQGAGYSNDCNLLEVRKNQARAVTRLQQKWSTAVQQGANPADDIAIITVLALASLARFLGDIEAYKVHRKNMSDMVSSRGGLDGLGQGGLAKCLLMQWDSFWVFQTEGSSLFPESRAPHNPVYPVFPLSPDLRDSFQKLPIGFQALVIQGKVSVELVEILGRAAEASTSGIESLAPGNMFHTQDRRYHDFVEACPCLGTPDPAGPNLERQICLALLLYCANAFTHARSSTAAYGGARTELTRVICSHPNQSWKMTTEEECAFWINVVCIDSWRIGNQNSALLDQGKRLLPTLKANKRSQNHEAILKKFFWSKELIEGCKRYMETPD